MLQQEFEELIGRKATVEEYEKANAMYEAAADMDKLEFCRHYDAIKDNPIALALAKEVHARERGCDYLRAENKKMKDACIEAAFSIIDDDTDRLYPIALKLIGRRKCVEYKIDEGLELDEHDKYFVHKALTMAS